MARKQGIRRSLIFMTASLLAILGLILFTSPIKNVTYAIPFFAAFLAFLVSLGYFLVYLRRGAVSRKARNRVTTAAIFITLLLMFRSAQSLSWLDALILLLVVGGLFFYSSRRGQ